MLTGLIVLPWWGYLVTLLALTHVTIVAVTVFLHRFQAHRAVDLHPAVALFFRTWLWLTTGMTTRKWVAVHRKHHAFVETEQDPHSPRIHGIRKVLWDGVGLYRREARKPETSEIYGRGTPDDWLERHVFRHDRTGVGVMLVVNLALFGPLGLSIWAMQMAWIPFFAAGVINGVAHWRGYRNFETADSSTNITPWGILIGGEELHNNHHAFASSARFALRPWEFDIGWFYIQGLALLKLATVRKVAPRLANDPAKRELDAETLSAMLTSRWHVMSDYTKRVVRRVHREEIRGAGNDVRGALEPLRKLLSRSEQMMREPDRARLLDGLAHSRALTEVYQFRQKLLDLIGERGASQDRLLERLQEWCRDAEASGVAALADFVEHMRGYALRTV